MTGCSGSVNVGMKVSSPVSSSEQLHASDAAQTSSTAEMSFGKDLRLFISSEVLGIGYLNVGVSMNCVCMFISCSQFWAVSFVPLNTKLSKTMLRNGWSGDEQ